MSSFRGQRQRTARILPYSPTSARPRRVLTETGNELLQRAAAEDSKDSPVFPDIGKAQACLDRDRQRRPGTDVLEKPLEPFRIAQKPGALAFCDNRSGRTAKIEIDLAVPELGQKARCPDKIVGILRQQLGDSRAAILFSQCLQRLLGKAFPGCAGAMKGR